MRIIASMLRQRAIWWDIESVGEDGRPVFAAPVVIKCRWSDVSQNYLDDKGVNLVSKSIVYVDRDVRAQGVLWLSPLKGSDPDEDHLAEVVDLQAPFQNTGAYEIHKVGKLPTLSARQSIRRAYL